MSGTADFRGRTVLVTGGAGYIGTVTCRQLAEAGANVIALDNFTGHSPAAYRQLLQGVAPAVEIIEGDAADERVFDRLGGRVDEVIHLAACADVALAVARPDLDFHSNVAATHTVLSFALKNRVRRLAFASSSSVYAATASGPISEDAATAPCSTYGNSKAWGERNARLYQELYELPTTSLRLFSVYGGSQLSKPGSHSWAVARFVADAAAGSPITIHGTGTQIRDFIHVEDVARAFVSALAAAAPTPAPINIGTGQPTAIAHLARQVAGWYPNVETRFGSRPSGDPDGCYADIRRANEQIGWTPRIDLAEGLKRYVEWFDGHRSLNLTAD